MSIGDVDDTPTYDVDTMSSDGWSTADMGVTYTKEGTYGIATFTVASGVVAYALADNDSDTQALQSGDQVTDSFTIATKDDNGATATADAVFTINGANDIQTLGDVGAVLAYKENDSASHLDGAISLSDLDDTHMQSATVQITMNYQSGEDILSISSGLLPSGVTAIWTEATGILTLSGSATVSDYESMLENIKYENSSEAPNESGRTVSWTITDASGNQATATSTINVESVNDAPVIDLDTPVTYEKEIFTESETVEGGVGASTTLATVNGSDVDDSTLTYEIISGNTDNYFEIDTDGKITLTDSGYDAIKASEVNNETFTLGIKVSDDDNATDNTFVTIKVEDKQISSVVMNLSDESDTGSSRIDDITKDTQPKFILDNIDSDATYIKVSANGVTLAVADKATGSWEFTNTYGTIEEDGGVWSYTYDYHRVDHDSNPFTPLQENAIALSFDGKYTFEVFTKDDANNSKSDSIKITLDTTEDDATVSLATDTFGVSTGGTNIDLITQDATVNLSGLEAESVWYYSTDAGSNWSDAQEASTTSFELSDNTEYSDESVQVKVVDLAGNENLIKMGAITIDNTPYNKPGITAITNQSDSDVSTIVIEGTSDNNAFVNIYSGGSVIGTVQASDTGSWSHNLTVSTDGAYSYYAKTIDLAGNESGKSNEKTIWMDASPATNNGNIIQDYIFNYGGHDNYTVDGDNKKFIESIDGAQDANFDLTGTGGSEINIVGNGNNIITTGSGEDTISSDGGNDNITTGDGDDRIRMDITNINSSDNIDAGDESDDNDVLELFSNSGQTIDMANILANAVDNIDTIDLGTDTNEHILSHISISDVISITDSDNILKITGTEGGNDKLKLDIDTDGAGVDTGIWKQDPTDSSGKTYISTQDTDGISAGNVKIVIDEYINVEDI
jgi:VCBS repeat-containing protein